MDLFEAPPAQATTAAMPSPRPRLYVKPAYFSRLKDRLENPWFSAYFDKVKEAADQALNPDTFTFPDPTGHNWHLNRARAMQSRLVPLSVQALLTGNPDYAKAAMQHVQMMHDWENWSWILWRQNQNDPSAIFDLSYGENSASLAIVWDWLQPFLSPKDKELIRATAQRPIAAFLNRARTSFWYRKPDTNWNAVCAGGMGMLALALLEEEPQAAELLASVEESITPFMLALDGFDGAWPEGIGYWNYGMRYAFMYLLSHENATGVPHSLLEREATRKTVAFPQMFCPHGWGCSFGDVNRWRPIPIHHEMAARLQAHALLPELKRCHPGPQEQYGIWPHAAETLLLVPDDTEEANAEPLPSHHLYHGLDWGYVADKMPEPSVYLSLRGGTTEVPHAHRDLTSFYIVMDGERVVSEVGGEAPYLDTTFSPRRFELYDTTPASKNVVLVNGVGICAQSQVHTEMICDSADIKGFIVDATEAMGVSRDSKPAVRSYRRLALLWKNESLLIVDCVELPHHGRCEMRWHTRMAPSIADHRVSLQGTRGQFTAMHACNRPAVLATSTALATSLEPVPTQVIRWVTEQLETRVIFATWFAKGNENKRLSVQDTGDKIIVILDDEELAFDGVTLHQLRVG